MPKSSSAASSRPSKSRIAGSKRSASSSSVAAAASSSSSSSIVAASSTSKPAKAKKVASGSKQQPAGVTLEPPQGKQLASTEKVIRDAAIKQLAAFLSQADDGEGGGGGRLDEADMRKLWKGLFYCFWMSDKPLVQQALASELSALILSIEPVSCESLEDRTLVALDFVAGFWECLVREWAGIDRLRLDKYYMFIRRFTHACFLLLRRASYAPSCVDKFNSILLTGPLSFTRQGVPPSLSWHLADIFLAEFATSLQTPPPPPVAGSATEPTTFIPRLFEPFVAAALHTNHATTFKRLVDSALTPLVDALDGEGADGLAGLKAVDGRDAVRSAVMQMIWRESGKESCRPEKRRSVLIWWKDQGGGEDDE